VTAQISDTFIFRGDEYMLIGIDGPELFSPEAFGMVPKMIHTACYRGYYATYELAKDALYLRNLTMLERKGKYVPIGGVKAVKEMFAYNYSDIAMQIPFTGNVRLAKGLIEESHINMGFPKAKSFKTIFDITMENGRVVQIHDRSSEMEEKRDANKNSCPGKNSIQNIEDAFSLDMDLE